MDKDRQRIISEDLDLMSIAQIFLDTPYRRLPVLREDTLIGQVSRRDVIRAAIKVIGSSPDRASTLLYLSALREMQDVPAV